MVYYNAKGEADAKRARFLPSWGVKFRCGKEGGPDPSVNSKLKDIIAKAKANNMPGDNILRCIKRHRRRRFR